MPLCHPLPLTARRRRAEAPHATRLHDYGARARRSARTGVEMEALVAGRVAALTLYDMLKAVDRGMVIGPDS